MEQAIRRAEEEARTGENDGEAYRLRDRAGTFTLVDVQAEVRRLQDVLGRKTAAFAKEADVLKNAMDSAMERINILTKGLDLDKIERARKVLWIWDTDKSLEKCVMTPQIQALVKEACASMETGKGVLFEGGPGWAKKDHPVGVPGRNYLGLKNYDRWHQQRSNHPVGYGPKHGHMVFRIQFTTPRRKYGEPLTKQEADDCIYYLLNLEKAGSTVCSG